MIINNSKNIRTLIDKLNQATEAYEKGKPYLTDMEWDIMYYKLEHLEEATGLIYPDSPTQTIHYNIINNLKKVTHNHPMLSLQKTKDIEDIKKFLGNKDWIAMAKMDGLTCSLRYVNGELVSAETRGNGVIGEDITHNAMVIPSIPKHIHCENDGEELIVDGEIICTKKDFEPFQKFFKNPRNFASGSIRLLDSKECKNRHLTFVAWDCFFNNTKYNISDGFPIEKLSTKLRLLNPLGFTVVPWDATFSGEENVSNLSLNNAIYIIKGRSTDRYYPIDGIVFKYDNITEYEAAGKTDHHFKGGIAYKFYDETYPTRLRHIDWTMGRTGVLTPVAVFDPIEIDGAEVSRASLHNVSVMRETLGDCAYVGEPLEVFKSNMIIPQIYSAGPKYNYGEVISKGGVSANDSPEFCPICHGEIAFKEENGIERAYCENPLCSGKLINRLDHFCGKKGLDIKGLSKKTLEKLIDWGWVNSLEDIFKLQEHRNEWIEKEGFGIASVDKILSAIEEGKNCTASKFIAAIGIPQIGKVASEDLIKVYHTYNGFRHAVDFPDEDDRLYNIKGIGEVMIKTLTTFDYTEADNIFDNHIIEIISSVPEEDKDEDKKLKDKIFVITGKTIEFKNRNELKDFIESNGGKVTGSVSKKTNYLVNNDVNSTSSKNKTAKELNIPIITEKQLIDLIN